MRQSFATPSRPQDDARSQAGCAADKLFTAGTWNADFHESMVPAAGDKVVSGKKGLDAFPGTDLEQILKDNGIETVALSGFLTNCCVESSMRTAYEKGFNTVARRRRPSRVAAAPRPILPLGSRGRP